MSKNWENIIRPGNLEIEQMIQYFYKCSLNLTVWQNHSSTKRIIKTMGINSLDMDQGTLELGLIKQDPNWLKAFNPDKSLYAHCDFKNFLCQFRAIKVGGNFIQVYHPDNVIIENNTLESRRIRFISNKNRVSFAKQDSLFDYPLVDISCTGMAFSVPKTQGRRFGYEDDEIQIKTIMLNRYESIIKANVVYITENEEDQRFRVGVRFQKSIDIHEVMAHQAQQDA